MARKRRAGPKLPGSFLTIGALFHQDIYHDARTPDELADVLVGGVSDAERPVLRAFLAEIVQPRYSGDDLKTIWSAACQDWMFMDGEELRRFLILIARKLGQGRTRPGWRPIGEGRNHGKRIPRPARARSR